MNKKLLLAIGMYSVGCGMIGYAIGEYCEFQRNIKNDEEGFNPWRSISEATHKVLNEVYIENQKLKELNRELLQKMEA